jgi:RNA polymerase sigma factor (sigma-70 family)
MHPQWIEEHLPVIDRAIAIVCAHASLRGADAEDFASLVKVALLDDDCALLRKWEGRSSLATYLTVVIRRLLVDQRRMEGRFYASAEAQRQGEPAVLLERLIAHEERGVEEAVRMVRTRHPELTAAQLEGRVRTLPRRSPRPRLVAIGETESEQFAAPEGADERLNDSDRGRRADEANRVMQAALRSLTSEDRLIFRLRFARGQTVADIARVLGTPQRPLYRRLQSLLATLRRALEEAGLDEAALADLIGTADERLNFQLRKSSGSYPSVPVEGSEAAHD